jgi:ABC-2 type transport system ATP-binding protein
MNAVELENITKTFGKIVAVDDLSLKVPQGSIVGFIGPNGSGKTTTMRMILNILYPDSGTVRIFGDSLRGAVTDRIGYMPEERGLYKRMRVREILQFYGRLKNGKDVPQEVDRWLERLGLADRAKKKVETLSKGMSQKVQFLAAVVARPELLILDEPFTGLDPVNADAIREAVLELRAAGATVVLSTHDMAVAEKMCDAIIMIFKGKKVLDGPLASIQDRFGSDVLRIQIEDGRPALEGLEGVEKVTDFGQFQELRVQRGRDPQAVLAALLSRGRLKSFEIAKPSLHDIFVRVVNSESKEVTRA